MNNGLKIILERMKTNPEEFTVGSVRRRRWISLLDDFWAVFTEEEKDQYMRALRDIRLPQFEEEVLKELLREEPSGLHFSTDGVETVKISSSGRYSVNRK